MKTFKRKVSSLTISTAAVLAGVMGGIVGAAYAVESPQATETDNTLHHDVPTAIALDTSSGSVVVTGSTSGSGSGSRFNRSSSSSVDAFLISYDIFGDQNWLLKWGEDGSDTGMGVAVDTQGDIYVTGRSYNSATDTVAWLRRYDQGGNLRGSEIEIDGGVDGAAAYYPHAIALDAEGRVYVAGYVNRSDGDTDAWLAAYTGAGQPLWFETIASDADDEAYAVTVDESGAIYVTGSTFGTLGDANLGGRDAWVAQYNSSGFQEWVYQLGGTGSDVAASIAVANGAVYLAGYTDGSVAADPAGGQDVWIAALDTDANPLWSEQFGSTSDDYAYVVDQDADEVTVMGFTDGELGDVAKGDGQYDGWVAKLTPETGEVTRVIQLGSPRSERIRAGFTDEQGNHYMTGDIEGDNGTDTSSKTTDAWAGKLSSAGKVVWLDQLGSAEPEKGGEGTYSVDQVGNLTRYIVPPALTDSNIVDWLSEHYVYVDENQPLGDTLVLYLSGSYGIPAHAELVLQTIASNGYPVISLNYPNEWTVGDLCNGLSSSDPATDCFSQIRTEILTGEDTTTLIDVSPTNSITNRLVKALQYLQQQAPEVDWGQWLDGDQPRWSSMILAGHSQGGGHSAFISKQHEVQRVVMFASPEDTYADGTPAAWISEPGVTPAERYYGFDHVNDPSWAKNQVNWGLLGMNAFGDVVEVVTNAPPFNNSHQLLTDIPPSTGIDHGEDTHGSVVVDSKTPIGSDGHAEYSDDTVWTYLCCSSQ